MGNRELGEHPFGGKLNTKSASVAAMGVMYIVAFGTAHGIPCPWEVTTGGILHLLWMDLVATGVIFGCSTWVNNSSVYDPYWSVTPLWLVLVSVTDVSVLSLEIVAHRQQ